MGRHFINRRARKKIPFFPEKGGRLFWKRRASFWEKATAFFKTALPLSMLRLYLSPHLPTFVMSRFAYKHLQCKKKKKKDSTIFFLLFVGFLCFLVFPSFVICISKKNCIFPLKILKKFLSVCVYFGKFYVSLQIQ
jgi:hypothetical protein